MRGEAGHITKAGLRYFSIEQQQQILLRLIERRKAGFFYGIWINAPGNMIFVKPRIPGGDPSELSDIIRGHFTPQEHWSWSRAAEFTGVAVGIPARGETMRFKKAAA